jgi:anti-anti-sigma factor
LAPRIALVVMRGEHDLSTTTALRAALEEGAAHSSVLVDLSECSFVDSTIIATILCAARHFQARGERFGVVIPAAQSQVQRVAEMIHLGELVPIYTSREDARAELTLPPPSQVDA